ncbi:nuclear transport factor 2 family protein [Streptomyces lutosisoli]|uniref:Nuclear transport factor 2 family protein n=1 Tax=Streptomyces lutosisoli TaxID=2665721 RepID=A0ABW2VGN9_9ACTN
MASILSTPSPAPTAEAATAAGLEERLRVLEDRAELVALVDRFVHGLDAPAPLTEDRYRALLTEDVLLSLPSGTHRGVAGLPGFLGTPKELWARTQHYATNCVVDVDGDTAVAHANIHAVHVPHDASAPLFGGGAHYDVRAERTAAGWRIAELTVSVLWTAEGGRG